MKLNILGASGSGVSTLGEFLATKLELPYFDSDDYFWVKTDPPFRVRRDPLKRNSLIIKDLNKAKSWILGGSVIQWGDSIFQQFDLVIFLYLPPTIRIERLKNREFERYGERIYKDPESNKQFNNYMAWATDYDHNAGLANRTFEAHKCWLRKVCSPILELIGDLSVEERAGLVISKLQAAKLID